MVTNVNEPVWSSGLITHVGGGDDASFHVPADIDVTDWSISVPAATTAQIQYAQDNEEAIHGISARPLRYLQLAVNDLGGSGEIRLNAASGQSFLDDGWAVGDGVTILSHKVPDFNDPNRTGKTPTGLGDVQFWTLDGVTANTLTFAADPAFSLPEGEATIRQNRFALTDGNLTWINEGAAIVGALDVTRTVQSAHAVRLIVTAGTGTVTYKVDARHQSRDRAAPFDPTVETRPYAGYDAGIGAFLSSASTPNVITWSRSLDGTNRAVMTVPAVDFDVDGVEQYDRLFVSRHSETGNGGMYTVKTVTGNSIEFYEPLRGTAGVDNPSRQNTFLFTSASNPVVTLGDYDELVLQILGGSASYLRMQDSPWPATLNPVLDSGPAGRTDWDESYTAGPNFEDGPMVGTTSPNGNFSRFNTSVGAASLGGASAQMTCGFWTIAREDAERDLVSKATDGDSSSDFSMRTQSIDDTVEAHWKGPLLADPGTWLANTAYVTGDRVRPSSDDNNVHECEVAGTSAVVSAGFQDGDYGGALTGGTATGLANDATVYTATVTVDGGADPISIVGSAAQTYTALISELDTDTTGGTWAINGGELRCTSSTTGETSTVSTVDTDLFATLTDFVSFNTAVPGDGEPTFASIGNTVVDGTVTWRHVSARIDFHDVTLKTAPIVLSPDNWDFLVCTRDSVGSFILYHQGVEVDRADVATADTVPGSFGTPVRAAFTVDYSQTEDATLHGLDGAFGPTNMPISFVIWDPTSAMTAAQVAALWDTAIDIGIVAVP